MIPERKRSTDSERGRDLYARQNLKGGTVLMQEKDIEKKLRIGIKGIGGLCLKWVSPGYTGVPDRMILLPGGIIRFAELKAPGKTERKRQIVVQHILRHMGFIVYNSVDSVDKVQHIVAECKEVIQHNE
nr:MAG TPA: Nuclease [Caudoviricetes sp.]